MPPKGDSNVEVSGGGISLNGKSATPKDIEFIITLVENLNVKVDANWDAIAAKLGLKDAKCTRERWRQIRVKFGIIEPKPGVEGGSGVPPVTPKRGRAPKALLLSAGVSDLASPTGDAAAELDELALGASPAKKKHASPKKKKAAAQNNADPETDGNAEAMVTPVAEIKTEMDNDESPLSSAPPSQAGEAGEV